MSTTARLNVLIGGNASQFYEAIGGVQKKLQSVSKDLDRISKDISMKVSAPLALLGGIASNTFATFEDSMLRVKSLTGATDDQFKLLNNTAKQLGATTRFSASQVGDAMGYMALAGWNTQQILGGVDGVLNLASASGEELAKVSDILTDGLSAFGKEAEYAGRMADILAMTSAKSNTTVGMLGEAFKYVAPLAGSLGFEVEDVTLALGLMANAGIKGSQAGTALRATISRLVKPTSESSKAIEELGLQITNADGSVKPLNEILTQLREKFNQLTPSQQAMYAGLLAGQEAMSGFLAIVNTSDSTFTELNNNIINSAGSAENMADIMESGLGGAFRRMKSNLESLLIMIGENLAPMLIKVADIIGKVTEKLNQLSPTTQKVITIIGVLIATIPPLFVGLSTLIKITTSVIVSFKTLTAVIPALRTGLLALNSALGIIGVALVVAVPLLVKLNNELKRTKDIAKEVREAQLDENFKNIKNEVEELAEKFQKIDPKLSEIDAKKKAIDKVIESYSQLYISQMRSGKLNADMLNKQILFLKEMKRELDVVKDSTIDINLDLPIQTGNIIKRNIIEPIREVKREFDITSSFAGSKIGKMGKKIVEASLMIKGSIGDVSWSFQQYMTYFHEFQNGTYLALEGIMTLGDGIQRMFMDLFTTGKLSFKGLIQEVGRFIAKLLSAIVAAAILSTLIKGLFPGLMVGDAAKAFSFGSLASQFSGGMLNFGGSRAMGGPVKLGDAYRVGENGVETFIPSTSGVILNQSQLSSMGGSSGGGEVTFKIQRDTLVGILKQDDRFKSRF